jgi:hypothetical protein
MSDIVGSDEAAAHLDGHLASTLDVLDRAHDDADQAVHTPPEGA